MAALVSGAVVLAQTGPPEATSGQRGPAASTKERTRSYPDGQSAALEEKLDRVLEALERISGTGDARLAGRQSAALNSMAKDGTRTTVLGPGVTKLVTVDQYFTASKEDGLDPRSLSDRMQAVEQQIQEILQRLGQTEEQLKSLDARIGGGRGVRRSEEVKKGL
jgi:hypothetical protein